MVEYNGMPSYLVCYLVHRDSGIDKSRIDVYRSRIFVSIGQPKMHLLNKKLSKQRSLSSAHFFLHCLVFDLLRYSLPTTSDRVLLNYLADVTKFGQATFLTRRLVEQ